MVNEATKVEGPYEIHDFTVASGNPIPLGTLCEFGDPRTAIISAGDGNPWAGVAATEKDSTDTSVELGMHKTGTFIMTAATVGPEGAIGAGDEVVLSGANLIRKAVAADLLTGAVIGTTKEAIAAASTGEVTLKGY